MCDFGKYMEATADERAAMAEYNHSSVALELAGIKKRLSEIKSQAEPLDTLLGVKMTARDRLYASAFYVVIGRMPEFSDKE